MSILFLKNKINNFLRFSKPKDELQKLDKASQFKYIEDIKKEKEEIIALQEVIQTVSGTLDLDKVLDIILDKIVLQLGFKTPSIFLINEKTKSLSFSRLYGTTAIKVILEKALDKSISDTEIPLTLEDNLLVKAANTGKIFYTNDLYDFAVPMISKFAAHLAQKMYNKLYGMKRMIVVPLMAKGKILGLLTISLTMERDLNEKENQLLKSFTTQAAIAIYNAQLFEQTQNQIGQLKEKTQDLQSLLDISAIAASSLDIKSITQKIVDSIPVKLGHLGYLGGFLALYNRQTTQLRAYSITESALIQKKIKDLLDKPFEEYSIFTNEEYNLCVEAIKTGEFQIAEETNRFVSPPVNKNIVNTIQKLMGIKACVVLPVFIRGEVIGTFMFMTKKASKEIGERDMTLMKAFANHIGISIDNAMLFDKTIKQIEELERTKNNLQEILTMKNEFLHIVSHQLRTPLTAVRGLISMWYDGDFDGYNADKMRGIKDRVKANADRLNNIINDIIVAMEAEGELKLVFGMVDVEKMIKEVIEMFKANFEKKGLYIKFDKIEEGLPTVEADPRNLLHAFMNIIDNAEKYTQKGGMDITLRRDDDNVSVRFTDTGVGITPEDQGNLFKKFSRGKKANNLNPNGSGLGLFIAKQIIDEHHGKIQLSSLGEGKGATFVVSLPMRQPDSTKASVGGAAAETGTVEKKTEKR